jgi:hypothetical protein
VYILAPSEHFQATRVAVKTLYWRISLSGFLLGLNVFETDLATQIALEFERADLDWSAAACHLDGRRRRAEARWQALAHQECGRL